jgi:hypothetical protein
MKRCLATLVVFALCTVLVRADVTLVQTTTVEGGLAAMSGASMSPTTTTRIKGKKSRTDIDVPNLKVVTITDLAAKQVTILRPDQKTATVVTPEVPPAAGTGAPAGTVSPAVAEAANAIASSIKSTGKSQTIDGIKCDEYTFATSVNLSEMTGSRMPPEAAAVMQDVKLNMEGSMWIAKDVPGAAEFIAFQKAAAASDMSSIIAGATGVKVPGMDRVMQAIAGTDGMAYLTEMTVRAEGTGQVADMMRSMGPMKITTKTTSVNTDSVADDIFTVPADYKVIKQ